MVTTAGTDEVRGGTLGSHARRFARYRTPWAIGALVVAFAAGRAVLGPLRWSDLVMIGAVAAAEPFIEWVVHSQVLHARPREVLGRTVVLRAARGHRLHHEDPTDLDLVLVPLWVLVYLPPGLGVLAFLLVGPALAATGLTVGAAVLLAYEWTHYLVHTSYRPRSRAFRRQWRHHRLHHYRNEGYWFGVTTGAGDVVLRTCPPAAAVPVSPTTGVRAASSVRGTRTLR